MRALKKLGSFLFAVLATIIYLFGVTEFLKGFALPEWLRFISTIILYILGGFVFRGVWDALLTYLNTNYLLKRFFN